MSDRPLDYATPSPQQGFPWLYLALSVCAVLLVILVLGSFWFSRSAVPTPPATPVRVAPVVTPTAPDTVAE